MAHTVAKVTRLVSTFGPAVTARSAHQVKREAGFWALTGPVKKDFVAIHRKQYVRAVPILQGNIFRHPPQRRITMSATANASTTSTSEAVDVENDAATVSCEWLKSKLGDVKVLDASWYMPAEQRKPEEEYLECHIPGALFFDIDKVSRTDTDLPHMLPSGTAFGRALADLSIGREDRVVVYDGKGIFSAPRAWWMFRAFGHERVHVLEGGLPRWKALGYETETGRPKIGSQEQPAPLQLNAALLREVDDVQRNLETKEADVIDARGAGRFHGTEPEPRKGVRGGHIPGSKNVPFPQVLTPDGKLKPTDELKSVFASAGVSLDRPIVTSCGTGVTACVLALALHTLGKKDVPVYDGSWTEWGGREDLALETS